MMQSSSRTVKSLKNSTIALMFYFINLVLQFYSRKIFLECLGTEVLGLNTTATNLLQFLNLAELGIGGAVGFSLYKPLYERDTRSINEIIALQGSLYRRIACVVIAGAAILMCFFPVIFDKMDLPLWYAYASFSVLLFSSLLSYFINYKQVLLSADQKDYKIQYTYKASMIVKVLVQAMAVSNLPNGYAWWLILEALFAIIGSWMLNRTIKRNYPFLANSALSLKELNRRHPLVQTKIRQVFFHKIAGFVLQQTSPLIIYGFASMTLVALYGNYTLIMMGIYSLVNALSNGLTAGIGNLVAEGDKKRIMPVFEELFSVRFLIACTISFGMLTLAQPFITLWIGEEFLLPNSTLCIMTGILFFNISRTAVDSFINAHGFYSDIYAPIIEALLNIGCSIGLGFFWGLNGILVGVLISLVIIPACWKPIFLFKINLKYGFGEYVKSYTIHLVMALGAAVISFYLLYILPIEPSSDVWQFLLYGLISVMLFSALLGLALWMTGCGLRHFLKRCESIINKV